jgi:hypothetical protein
MFISTKTSPLLDCDRVHVYIECFRIKHDAPVFLLAVSTVIWKTHKASRRLGWVATVQMQIPLVERLGRLEVLESEDLPDRVPEISKVNLAHIHLVGRVWPLENVEELAEVEGGHVCLVVGRGTDRLRNEFPDCDEGKNVQAGEDAEQNAAGGDDGHEKGEDSCPEEVDRHSQRHADYSVLEREDLGCVGERYWAHAE